jgi:hypothetical protein
MALIGRAFLFVLFMAGVFLCGQQVLATVERVGAPSPLVSLVSGAQLTPQASRRMDGVCEFALERLRTAESLRYCGLIQLVERPGEGPSQRKERYTVGAEYLRDSLNRAPFSGITWLYLAQALAGQGDLAGAAAAFDSSYSVDAVAAGMAGMRVSVGLGMVDMLRPITRWSLDTEIILLAGRNPRQLIEIGKSHGRMRYIATALAADPQLLARFIRLVRAPPPGVRR